MGRLFFKEYMKHIKDDVKKQVMYLGRWVDKDLFRAFVYNIDGDKKLANSYYEFESLISSGIWFDSIQNISKEVIKSSRKSKHDTSISNG